VATVAKATPQRAAAARPRRCEQLVATPSGTRCANSPTTRGASTHGVSSFQRATSFSAQAASISAPRAASRTSSS
jgi:hypothetical protein